MDRQLCSRSFTEESLQALKASINQFRRLFVSTLCTALPNVNGRRKKDAPAKSDDHNPDALKEEWLEGGFTAYYPNFENAVARSRPDQVPGPSMVPEYSLV